MTPADGLVLERDGAERIVGAAREALPELMAVADRTQVRAGTRLHGDVGLARLLSCEGAIGRLASLQQGKGARPARAILFDKSPQTNWGLGWHQDRTIAVRDRRDVPGFGPWSVKRGVPHVAPPISLLERMLTIRVHLDDVPSDNAPLLVAPGSHRFGRISEGKIAEVVKACGIQSCLAGAGDVWLYATPILHASEASRRPGRRRVLQVDYAAETLPGGLDWFGV
jgi:hypothetical protein